LTWRALEPHDALELMRGYDRPWWVGGGWALDLFLGERKRDHEDLDVVVLRRDQDAVRAHLAGWDLQVAHSGELSPWTGERIDPPRHTLWARSDATGPWELELVLVETERGLWRFRRDPSVTMPLERVGIERDGIPFLAPEIALLYKAKESRERDEADFASVLPHLEPERRRWLAEAIRSQDRSHPWLGALEAK
jgi:hypothetical protein